MFSIWNPKGARTKIIESLEGCHRGYIGIYGTI